MLWPVFRRRRRRRLSVEPRNGPVTRNAYDGTLLQSSTGSFVSSSASTSRSRFSRLLQRGFTLLELLVVMVIIGLLAGYVGPKYFSQIGKSEVKAARAQIDALEKALDQYRLDVGRYPNAEQGLGSLMKNPGGEKRWQGPYLKKDIPADPWGNAYQYRQPGEHGEFDLFSYGKDGKPGGEEENADITNW